MTLDTPHESPDAPPADGDVVPITKHRKAKAAADPQQLRAADDAAREAARQPAPKEPKCARRIPPCR